MIDALSSWLVVLDGKGNNLDSSTNSILSFSRLILAASLHFSFIFLTTIVGFCGATWWFGNNSLSFCGFLIVEGFDRLTWTIYGHLWIEFALEATHWNRNSNKNSRWEEKMSLCAVAAGVARTLIGFGCVRAQRMRAYSVRLINNWNYVRLIQYKSRVIPIEGEYNADLIKEKQRKHFMGLVHCIELHENRLGLRFCLKSETSTQDQCESLTLTRETTTAKITEWTRLGHSRDLRLVINVRHYEICKDHWSVKVSVSGREGNSSAEEEKEESLLMTIIDGIFEPWRPLGSETATGRWWLFSC